MPIREGKSGEGAVVEKKNKEQKVKRKGKKDDRQVEEVRQGLLESW